MTRITKSRIIDVERQLPRQWQPLTVSYGFVEAVDGKPGLHYVGFKITKLPPQHIFEECQLQFAQFTDLVTRRIWGARRGGPWTICEHFDPPAPEADLPAFDVDAAFSWSRNFPDEFEPYWGKESADRWVRTVLRLAWLENVT